MYSILTLFIKTEVRNTFFNNLSSLKIELKSIFFKFYNDRLNAFNLKVYIDKRIFNNFDKDQDIYFGLLKILFFFHAWYFFIDLIYSIFYFLEFLLNIFLKIMVFYIYEFFAAVYSIICFLALERQKYHDYDKLNKEIQEYLRKKGKYKQKNKYIEYFIDYIDLKEKKIKSFLRKKKWDIKIQKQLEFLKKFMLVFDLDINLYLTQSIDTNRHSFKKWFYRFYFFFLSFIYFFSSFFSKIYRAIISDKFRNNVFEFYLLLLTYPYVIKFKLFLINIKYNIWVFFDKCFLLLYKISFLFLKYFFMPIRAFFYKIYIPFYLTYRLRKELKDDIVKKSGEQFFVSEKLCILFKLDYNLVIQDKKKVLKYFNSIDYSAQLKGLYFNNYFLYLQKYYLKKHIGNADFDFRYSTAFFFNIARLYNFFLFKIWPHIYVISEFILLRLKHIFSILYNFFFSIYGFIILLPSCLKQIFIVYSNKLKLNYKILIWLFNKKK